MRKVLVKNLPNSKGKPEIKVNHTIRPVDREDANVEVEKGEAIVTDTMFSGFPEMYIAGGEPHSNGGTPLNLPDNSFVFSKDKSMRIKDETIQKSFDKTFKKKGYIPAELAKQYDINDYRKILAEKDSDKMQRETAETMIENYNSKLGQLALVQESMKGFPDGIPFISIPYLEGMGIDPASLVGNGNPDEVEAPMQSEEDVNPQGQMKMGGQMKIRIKALPKAQYGKEPGVTPHKSKTLQGKTTPTLANSDSPLSPEQYAEYYKKFEIDSDKLTDIESQKLLYDKADPFVKAAMWGKFGDTIKGGTKNKYSQFGLLPDENFDDYRDRISNKYGGVEKLNEELDKHKNSFADGKSGARTATLLTSIKEPTIDKFIDDNNMSGDKQQVSKDLYHPGFETQSIKQDNPFWTQDVANMTGAFGDLQRLKKYMPWQANYNTVLPEATFYDPTRELAANAEMSNISAQALGAFTGPQQLSSRLSSVQGQGLANAANILGKYNNLNVDIANKNNAAQTDIMNQANVNQANQATALYDKTVNVNQNFDNAKTMARQNLRQSFVNAWTNRGKTQSLNVMNKQYKVDPITGYTEFTGVADDLNPQAQTQNAISLYNQIRSRPGMTDESAIRLFENIYGKNK